MWIVADWVGLFYFVFRCQNLPSKFKFSRQHRIGHFTLLFCRGRQRNVQRVITHVQNLVLLIKPFVWHARLAFPATKNNSVEIAYVSYKNLRYTFDKSAEEINGKVLVPSSHVKVCDFLGFVEFFPLYGPNN